MTYDRFLRVLLGIQKEQKILDNLRNNGVDLINFTDSYQSIINELIKEIYGEDGYEWFSWYCYDNEFGQKDWSTTPTCKMKENGTTELINEAGEVRFGAHDAEGNPICYSHESLWEYLEKNHQVYKVVKRI